MAGFQTAPIYGTPGGMPIPAPEPDMKPTLYNPRKPTEGARVTWGAKGPTND